MAVIYANASDFQETVATGTVLLDFYADWCAPCRMLGPVLEQIANDQDEIKVVKVNVDEAGELAQQYGIRGIPTLMIFKGGQIEGTKVGALSKSQLTAFIDSTI